MVENNLAYLIRRREVIWIKYEILIIVDDVFKKWLDFRFVIDGFLVIDVKYIYYFYIYYV